MSDGNLKPVDFDEANKRMVADGCGDLPVFHEHDAFISCWEVTEEQLAVIAKTRRIWLGVLGKGQPPVWLTVELPFRPEWPEVVQTNEGEENGKS